MYTDFCGLIPVPAVGLDHIQGAIYLLTFIDDYSRKTWVYPIKRRDHLYRIFDAWKAYVELTYQAKVKALRADNALEYKSLATRLRPSGVAVEFTVDYTPWQNGVAERMNRTIFSLVRSLLFESGLPDSFWGLAAMTAAYLRNRAPIGGSGKTPEEILTGSKPRVDHLRVFGCVAYAWQNRPHGKLDADAVKCIFIRYYKTERQYSLYDPARKAFIRASTVDFYEKERYPDL